MGVLYSPYPFLSWWTFEYLHFAVVIGIGAMDIHVQAFHVDIFSLPLNIVALNLYTYIYMYVYIYSSHLWKATVFQAPYFQH